MTVYDKLRLLGEAVTQEKAAEAMGVSPYYFRQVLRDKYRVGRHLSPISRPLRLRNTTPITRAGTGGAAAEPVRSVGKG